MAPTRIKLSRSKGAKMPPNSVSVARPSRWGNPFQIKGPYGNGKYWIFIYSQRVLKRDTQKIVAFDTKELAQAEAVRLFSLWFSSEISEPGSDLSNFRDMYGWHGMTLATVAPHLLRGKNLGCYCKEGTICHTDVILKIANPTHDWTGADTVMVGENKGIGS